MLVQYTQIVGWGWDNGPGKALLHGATLVFLTWTWTITKKDCESYLTLCKPTTIAKKGQMLFYGLFKSLSAAELAEIVVYPHHVDTLFFQRLFWIKSPQPCHSEWAVRLCNAAGCEWLSSPLTCCTEGLIPGRGHHRFQLWSDQYSTLFPAWQSIRHT